MSAVIVLILRIMMIAALYGFLVLALILFLREMRYSIRQTENQQLSAILLTMDKSEPKSFSQKEIFIGRDPQNDLQVQDDTISSRHARINYLNTHWMLEDLQSTNGTYLNDEKISSPTALVDTDIIRCGKIGIKVSFKNS